MTRAVRAFAATRATALVGLLAALALAGCGIPMQSEPQALPPNLLPSSFPAPSTAPSTPASTSSPNASPSSSAPQPALLRLWFVADDGLAPTESTLPVGSGPAAVLEALAAGPDAAQTASGLRTIARDPLTGLPLVSLGEPVPSAGSAAPPQPDPQLDPTFGPTFGPTPGPTPGPPDSPDAAPAAVTVRVSSAFTALPPAEQVLLLGQVVLSLSGAGLTSVAFTDEAGTSLAVPLPDGRLLDRPATARDYAQLIVRA